MKRLILIVISVIILASLLAWRFHLKSQQSQMQAKGALARKNAPAVVTVASAAIRDIKRTYQAVGSVESPYDVKLAAQTTGRIIYLQVREGDHVTRGEVLVRIDPSLIESQIAQDEAGVAQAKERLAQAAITTNANRVTIYSQISQQEAALSTAQANLQQAKQNYISQVAAAEAAVSDSQSKVDSSAAAIHAAQAAVLSNQAQLEYANSNLTRYQSLYKQGFVSTQQLDNARTQLTVEQAAVKASQEQLKSAESLKNSAQEEWKASEDQLKITQTQGKTGIQNSQNSLKQVVSSLASAKANTAQDPAYLANVAALRAAVVASVGLLQNAQAQLANNIIRSSIDGYVTARDADPGAAVTAGEPLLEIQSLDKVYVSVSVPEEVIRYLSAGQSGLVDMDGLPGRRFTGLITRINPAGDPASRQFTVYITLNNPRRIIKPGMFARVTFTTEKISGALTVPREAIVQGKNGPYVVVVEKGIARIRTVKTVGDQTALVQVVSGLKAGEQVVVLSVSAIRAGQHVKPAAFSPLASSAGLSE